MTSNPEPQPDAATETTSVTETATDTTTQTTTTAPDAGSTEPPPPDPVTLQGINPSPTSVNVDPSADLVLTFNKSVVLGTGSIQVYDVDHDAVFETIPVSDSRVVINGQTVTIDLDSILAGTTGYSVTVPAQGFEGTDGGAFEGVAAADWTFDTASVVIPGGVTTSELVFWYDAQYTKSLKLQSGGVRLWADRSGNGVNLTQSAAGSQPTVASAAFGSQDAIRFDGSNDFLLGPDLQDPSAYDLFVVWQSSTAAANTIQAIISDGVVGNVTFQMTYGHQVSGVAHAAVSGFNGTLKYIQYPTPATATRYIWNASYASGSGMALYTNGAAGNTDTSMGSTALDAATELFALGASDQGSYPFPGDIAEVLLFNRALTGTERDAVETYLGTRWGVTLQ